MISVHHNTDQSLVRTAIEIVICVTPHPDNYRRANVSRHARDPIQPMGLFLFCWLVGSQLPLCAMVVSELVDANLPALYMPSRHLRRDQGTSILRSLYRPRTSLISAGCDR